MADGGSPVGRRSRVGSLERGARVAETGSLVRARSGSTKEAPASGMGTVGEETLDRVDEKLGTLEDNPAPT